MNREYIIFKDFAMVEDQDGNVEDREYENNFEEVLKQENKIETLEKIISDSKREKEKMKDKIEILKILSDKFSWIIYSIVAFYFLLQSGFGINGLIKALVVLGTGKFILTIEHTLTKYFEKQVESLDYKIKKSKTILEEEIEELKNIKNRENTNDTVYNEFVRIDNDESLYRLERNLYLAYLYKLKEDIIQKKLMDDSIDSYLSKIKIDNERLDQEDKTVILDYANNKKRKLNKVS